MEVGINFGRNMAKVANNTEIKPLFAKVSLNKYFLV